MGEHLIRTFYFDVISTHVVEELPVVSQTAELLDMFWAYSGVIKIWLAYVPIVVVVRMQLRTPYLLDVNNSASIMRRSSEVFTVGSLIIPVRPF
jgi:hypothetical protein